jgi:hypothetical protein
MGRPARHTKTEAVLYAQVFKERWAEKSNTFRRGSTGPVLHLGCFRGKDYSRLLRACASGASTGRDAKLRWRLALGGCRFHLETPGGSPAAARKGRPTMARQGLG